jgi:hypothetical protein
VVEHEVLDRLFFGAAAGIDAVLAVVFDAVAAVGVVRAPTINPAPSFSVMVLYSTIQPEPSLWFTTPSFIGATKFRTVK